MGSLGIVVTGNALLTSGNQPEVGDKTNIKTETENKENTSTSKKEAYLKELQNMDLYDQTGVSKDTISNTKIIDQILEEYNEDLSEKNKEQIDENDLGIIYQSAGSVGQIIQDASGNYIKSPKSVDQLEEGQVHVDEQIKDGYFLVNNENHETIAGVVETEDGYHEITVDYANIKNTDGSEVVYTKNPDTYVHLEELFNDQLENGEISWNTIGESLEKYYGERVNDLSNEDEGR